MTVLELIGCTLIAFGPSLSMFILTVCKDPIRIIILISSAFFWLLSLLTSSIWWFIVIPLREYLAFGLVFSVIYQEMFRYLFYRLLRNAEAGLQKVSEVGVQGQAVAINRVTLSYVSGLGFGIMSGAFSLVNVIAETAGPGTVGLRGDSHNFFISSAFLTMAFVLLHTFWGIIFFQSLDVKNYYLVSYVVATHLFVSCLSLVNQNQMYLASIIPTYIVAIISGIISFFMAGGSWTSFKRAFKL